MNAPSGVPAMPALIIALSYLFAAVAPAQEEHRHGDGGEHDRAGEAHHHGAPAAGAEHEAVPLTPEEREEFGIVVTPAGPGIVETHIDLPGEVRPNADRLAHIVPRYSGIVTEVRANIGDRVGRGEVLAVIEGDASLAPFEVKTLLPGTVIEKHVALGEAVSRDHDLFVIADLSTVWIDLAVYQSDLPFVRVGRKAEVYLGHELAHHEGTIGYVAPVIAEETRTATARMVLANAAGRWRPGMFVTARILAESAEVSVAVPMSALHTFDGATVVFVETAAGFAPRPVLPGRRGEGRVEIVGGLLPGDRYVAEGGFTIKAELGKDEFGHGHGH